MTIDIYKEDLEESKEHILDALRAFFCRMDSYIKDFHQSNCFENASCLIDTIKSEIETLEEYRNLYFIARITFDKLEKALATGEMKEENES